MSSLEKNIFFYWTLKIGKLIELLKLGKKFKSCYLKGYSSEKNTLIYTLGTNNILELLNNFGQLITSMSVLAG